MLVYLSRYPVDQTRVSVTMFTDMILSHFTGAYLSHSESSRNLRNKKKPQTPERKVSFEPSYCSKFMYKNWVTRILVSCVINHKMLWDSAHKSCHGPKAKLNANCFEKCCLLETAIHPSICPQSGRLLLSPTAFLPTVNTARNWPEVVKATCKSAPEPLSSCPPAVSFLHRPNSGAESVLDEMTDLKTTDIFKMNAIRRRPQMDAAPWERFVPEMCCCELLSPTQKCTFVLKNRSGAPSWACALLKSQRTTSFMTKPLQAPEYTQPHGNAVKLS